MHCFKDLPIEKTRSAVGRFGITGKAQTQPIKNLSDGLRSRVVFAKLAYETPNMVTSTPKLLMYLNLIAICKGVP